MFIIYCAMILKVDTFEKYVLGDGRWRYSKEIPVRS
jgi:hypothetical protein